MLYPGHEDLQRKQFIDISKEDLELGWFMYKNIFFLVYYCAFLLVTSIRIFVKNYFIKLLGIKDEVR